MIVDYQVNPPPFDLNETLNQWEDWVAMPCGNQSFPRPAFTLREANLLTNVGLAWSAVCDVTDADVLRTSAWVEFECSAMIALKELNLRERFAE